MAKKIKLDIKNSQLAKALKVPKTAAKRDEKKKKTPPPTKAPAEEEVEQKPKRRIRARTRSAFAEEELAPETTESTEPVAPPFETEELPQIKEEAESPPPKKRIELAAEKASEMPQIIEAAPPKKEKEKKEEKPAAQTPAKQQKEEGKPKKGKPAKKPREFRDLKPKGAGARPFDSRDRHGLRRGDEDRWRKRRAPKTKRVTSAEEIIRPSELSVRLPISIKDLAAAMKLKASQLVGKLFMQGVAMTLNDVLDDETTIQLLGQEFDCEITIDTSEEERLRITDQTVAEEIRSAPEDELRPRAPVVTFMGHVDHGKTSLIDRIRQANVASTEAGAITQHIGAFCCQTNIGPITILDTPGHEAFTAMRARGADVTDVVVLVVAGDEGIRQQTEEAIQHARAAGVTILVALNKCDKPNFNAENVYRQLSEMELLPEKWGGEIITVNCSASTGEGIDELLEMIALQTEVLELKAHPSTRARGRVLESEMHKGLGSVATILVQNGTLKHGDALVFDDLWGRVKTLQDDYGKSLEEAGPATPAAITGLSGLPKAGSEFIVVANEKEAREIAEARHEGTRQLYLQKSRAPSLEHLFAEAAVEQKQLNLILRADVQGSLEALKTSIAKIESEKAKVEIILAAVGAVSESDIELAIASNAVIIGFHTQVESHAESLIKRHKVQVRLHDVIYHAIDDVRNLLAGTLEKVAEERPLGTIEVRATFRASQLGTIAGCYVLEGLIHRNAGIRQLRDGEVIWKGGITSIRRDNDDVREVKGGFECGILLAGQNDVKVGDTLEAFETIYVEQQL